MVTRLKLICNNNTHLTVYPYFSSDQITRIINCLNFMIKEDTALHDALKKMYGRCPRITCSYEMLYFVITRQTLYTLYLQLDSTLSSYRLSYGLRPYPYSIDDTKLEFSFWNQSREDATNRVRLYIDSENDLACLKGTCNDRVFTVDLVRYRIMDIILDVALDSLCEVVCAEPAERAALLASKSAGGRSGRHDFLRAFGLFLFAHRAAAAALRILAGLRELLDQPVHGKDRNRALPPRALPLVHGDHERALRAGARRAEREELR